MLLELRNINKSFFDTKALDNISFKLAEGEIHAIIGENGAGKSTMINIIAGIYPPDDGQIIIEDKDIRFSSPHEAQKSGISVIHQEPMLVPNMSVAENIYLGNSQTILGIFTNYAKMRRKALETLQMLGSSIDPNARVYTLNLGEQYVVSIAKAISRDCKILVMDEPTANLTEEERKLLFRIIKRFKKKGVGIIYITHQLEELSVLCDRVTILRDGKHMTTCDVEAISKEEIVRLMLGKDLLHYFPPIHEEKGEELLRVESLSQDSILQNISFSVFEGEILGIAGLSRSGRVELAKAIFGQYPKDSGEIYWRGAKTEVKNPHQAVHQRIGYVSEDRLKEGLLANMNISENMTISSLHHFNRWQFVKKEEEQEATLEKVMELDIKLKHIQDEIRYLSGGNQQKIMVGKWLVADSELYLLNEPTRGIDIGARCELYLIMHELAMQGKGLIVISSDVSELIGLCHRILVMRDGQIADEIHHHEATEERIRKIASG